ncbi:GPI-GlcNAc transferase complex, PIG-H component [Popillia japonica]|uniref:GPI-GlcNAc transferase complex, PIG-H component n=1 Tax=Popillia japonica TaxID=7064 RepID=A0AAW1IDM2_POPJA
MCSTDGHSIESIYENIKGHTLQLKMSKFGNVTDVTIRKQIKYSLYSQCCLLLLILLTNIFAFAFNIVTLNYFLILLLVTSFFAYKIFSIIQYGCQITVKYSLGYSTKFIPQHSIGGVFINEVFSMQRVLFVLSILIKEHNTNKHLIPLFTGTKPRLNCIEVIYRELQM